MTIQRIPIDPRRDRETWLALRMQDITASDVGAVCGEGIYDGQTPVRVWAEKLHKLPPQEMNDALRRGIWGEAAVFSAIEDLHPDWDVRRAKVYFRDAERKIGATPDGAAIIPGLDGVTVVQAKVVSRPFFDLHWRADPGDKSSPVVAPLAYQLQTLTETMLSDGARGLIAALVVDAFKWSLELFYLERNEPAWLKICERIASFRANYLDTGVQPPVDTERDAEIIKALYPRDNGLELDLSTNNELPGWVDQLEAARQMKKEAEKAEAQAKTALADVFGEASIIRIAGGRRISNKYQERGSYVVAPTGYRVMRVLKK